MNTFDGLDHLTQHCERISQQLQTHDYYLVGGVVRDILLGINKPVTDIDITGPHHPDQWWSTMKSDGISRFRTEKFGTMTIVRQLQPTKASQLKDEDNITIQYEITPFRQEGGYKDFRHPTEITWSNSLLKDAIRRDFTVNCLYYKANVIGETIYPQDFVSHTEFNETSYQKYGYYYSRESKTIVINDHTIIQQITENHISLHSDIVHIVLDPYLGLSDIMTGTLKCVGNPDDRFQEDALRILRALRFVNIFNQTTAIQWDFHRDTWRSMQKYHFLVQNLAKERIRQEIIKVFSHNNPFGYISFLDSLHLLSVIFPAVYAIKGLEQPIRYHPLDTYHHTLMTLRHVQQITTDRRVKLAMLYHDVGKVEQYKLYSIGLTKDEISIIHGSWLNHTVCGPDFVKRDLGTLTFSTAEIEHIAWLVQYHMYPGQILMSKPESQVKKIRALLSDSSYEQMKDLLDVMEGDRLGHYNPIQSQHELNGPAYLRDMLDMIYHEEGQITLKTLAIDGDTIINTLHLKPGKIIGLLLQRCLKEVLSHPEYNTPKHLLDLCKKEHKKYI